jgi:rhodanese-related sulfurtransferase
MSTATAHKINTLQDVIRLHGEGQMVVIDVRGADEIARSGKAKNAVHIPLMMITVKADPRHPEYNQSVRQDQPIGIYCASGGRSGMATQQLRQMGYREVYNLGGFGDWVAAGGAVDR